MTTCAVILHYANDFHKVMDAAKKAGVDEFVLVDNSRNNIGVAAGYKKGIMKALTTECDYIWLLDDDNIPAEDALDQLFIVKDHYNISKKSALVSFREYGSYSVNIDRFIGSPNAVLGLNIFRYKYTREMVQKRERMKTYIELTACAMYGGMFFHRDLIKIIGYPDEKYFLYGGDYEWSSRITENGGQIIVAMQSIIKEPEPGQMTGNRVFEATKGHIMFQKKFVTNRLKFWLNYRIYLEWLALQDNFNKRRALKAGYKS